MRSGCGRSDPNMLLLGSPGVGKSRLGRRLTTILPAMSLAEAIETTCIHRVAGLTGARTALVTTRPCRAPHHTISDVGRIGGGHIPTPGEVSRAHHGMRFLEARPASRCHGLITIAYRRLVSFLSAVLSCVTRTTRPIAMIGAFN